MQEDQISISVAKEGNDWIQNELLIQEDIPVSQDGKIQLGEFLGEIEEFILARNEFKIDYLFGLWVCHFYKSKYF